MPDVMIERPDESVETLKFESADQAFEKYNELVIAAGAGIEQETNIRSLSWSAD